ncbi:D-beta-hydroxybutyrate dehydrogenase, mitochondrial [Halotydeus destructor]|nr:D-beta-hydroxybutyrate dehydrogenase, mitochondrial [Halotydeus destructor]
MIYKLSAFSISAIGLFYLESVHQFSGWLLATVGSSILILSLSWLCSSLAVRYLIHKSLLPRVDPNDKAILVTGCDSGFGQLFALRLNELGFHVFAGCLFPKGRPSRQDGPQLATALTDKAKFADRLTIVGLDVTSDDSVNKALSFVSKVLKSKQCQLYGLVNNAGIVRCGESEWGDFDQEYRATMEVNVLGPVRVTRAFLPLLRDTATSDPSGGGRIVNMASLAGRITFPLFTSYSMSKHALISYSDGLRRELDKFAIKVITVEPFIYKTPMIVNDLTTNLESCWKNTDHQVRTDYGDNYFRALLWYVRAFVTYWNPLMVSDQPGQVVQSVEEALTLANPEHCYVNCHPLIWPAFWLYINLLPSDFFELYMKYYTYLFNLLKAFFK